MAATPSKIKVKVDMDHPKIKEAIEYAEKMGREEGLQQGRQEILDWLERAYINDPGRPDRGSPKAEAMLELARDAADHFRKLTKKKGRRK
jgi:hypothetical protein